jgi:transcriptional regulator with XRE-family HTH domain
MSDFGALLRSYREHAGVSQRALARASGINSAIVSRLESGDREPSGQEQVLALAGALKLGQAEADRLLAQAGFWPTVYLTLGPADVSLLAVARVLASGQVDGSAKARFRRVIDELTEQWLVDGSPSMGGDRHGAAEEGR